MTEPTLKIVKPSFSEKFKSKNAPTISGVQTLLTALPIHKIGEVDDWTRLHPSEGDYWTDELCFVWVPVKGAKRNLLHVIDDDLAVQYLPAKKIKRFRLALACKPNNVFFFCIVPSQNLDNTYNADALKACYLAQTHWVQAMSRQSEGAEGYEIKFAQDQDASSRTGVADTFEGRTAGSHVQGRQYRPRPASRLCCA